MDPVVLIVDDNEDNRFTLSMRLEACGYENIVTAENGREALEKMRQSAVDLVLLDIMMPELDGYGVLEELRTDTALRDIPVVMISALEDVNSVVRCIELGATDYLTKPFNPVLLKARVDKCIERARYKAQEAAHLARIESEKRRADELLTTVLPRSIARALKLSGRLAPQRYEDVSVLFCDVVGFTAYSERHPPETVFAELESLVDRFEEIAQRHGLEKIKTVGDAFMATANLLSPWPCLGRHHGQEAIPVRCMGRYRQHRGADRGIRPAGQRQHQRPRLASSAQPGAGPLAWFRRPQGQGKD